MVWPGINRAVRKWVRACRVCQNAKTPPSISKVLLKNINKEYFNEIVQIHHQKICQTKSAYTGILVMIHQFTKFVRDAPYEECTAEETRPHLMKFWIARHSVPTFVQSDNGLHFAAYMTQEFLSSAKAVQLFSIGVAKPNPSTHATRVFLSLHGRLGPTFAVGGWCLQQY